MRRRLIVVGPLPPPLHGVTVSTSLVLANERLARAFVVEHLDTSDHRDGANIGKWDLDNVIIGVRGGIAFARRTSGRRGVVYLPVSQSAAAFLRDSLFIHAAALRGWLVAVHLRGSEFLRFYESSAAPLRWWIRTTLRRVDAAAVVGESLLNAFGSLIPPSRVAVVPNGTPPPDCGELSRDPKTVLFLSNLRRRKGVLEASQAARIVCARRSDARFVFAGAWEDDALRQEIAVVLAPCADRVEFAGVVQPAVRDALLCRAGILLFPPREPEGHPRVVLEAMAAGLPVVATDRGAIRETVGEAGVVLDEPDPAGLADSILRLMDDPAVYRAHADAARSRYETRYTQAHADMRLAEWLERVAAR